ncbi:SpoIIE family protein phosphatase [Streptomyces sp. NPDC002845]
MSVQSHRSGRSIAPTLSPRQWHEEYMDLFEQAPMIFAALRGPRHMVETANSVFFEAAGYGRKRLGVPIGELMPELVPQGVLDRLDEVYRRGTVLRARNCRLVLGEPGAQRERFFDVTYEPRHDAVGGIDGVVLIAIDTTAYHDAQLLVLEQRALLEQIARDAPLKEILSGMARSIEELSPAMTVSVLLADADGRRLRHGAAPGLPDFYNEAIDGTEIGDGVGSCGTAAHRRAPVIVTDIATDPLWKDYRRLAKRAGVAACWSTPILATDGRLLGTFAMYHRTPMAPVERDLALGAAFTRIAALAIERHQAVAAGRAAQVREKEAREDLAFVLDTSTAIAREQHYADSLRCLARLAVPRLAPLCAVHVRDGGRIRRIAVAAARAEEDLFASPCLSDEIDQAVARVLASGTTESRRPGARPDRVPSRPGAGYVCVPLAARGHTFGVLTLLATGRELDGHTVALAHELARRAATSADNARQFTDRVLLARDLQAGLLPPELPPVPGTTLAASYHPAGEGLDVGGDFYDVFPLPGDRWAFMIGDVCGRGATAATTTGTVRHTARAVAPLLHDPVAVVAAINDALTDHTVGQEGFVSLVYGELRHTTSHLAVAVVRAGHVPPLVRRAEGSVEQFGRPGVLLGLGCDPEGPAEHVDLHPGDSLVLVTDGITEARSASGEFFGEERLADALTGHRSTAPTASALLESITAAVTAFAGDTTRDDQATLVISAM